MIFNGILKLDYTRHDDYVNVIIMLNQCVNKENHASERRSRKRFASLWENVLYDDVLGL